jgi:hypothetical protein
MQDTDASRMSPAHCGQPTLTTEAAAPWISTESGYQLQNYPGTKITVR